MGKKKVSIGSECECESNQFNEKKILDDIARECNNDDDNKMLQINPFTLF